MSSTVDRIVLNPLRGAMVATLQGALTDKVLEQFRADVLDRLEKVKVSHLILDFSGMALMDPDEFSSVMKVAAMTRLMGVEAIVAGLRPEVVYALIQMDVDTKGIRSVLSVDDAFENLDVDINDA
jgi:rsbT antagonist protein RsbS